MNQPSLTSQTSSHYFEIVSQENLEKISAVKELVWEYFCWGNNLSIQNNGFDFNIQQMFLDYIESLSNYQKSDGVLYLLRTDTTPIGTGCFKKLTDDTCELKLMYIREAFRKNGLGNRLLRMLIESAKRYNYLKMRLITAQFMKDALSLYEKLGFIEIPVYNNVESLEEFLLIIRCMKLDIRKQV